MHATTTTALLFASTLLGLASAHFQLQFPQPRGVFVEDDEPKFCDGYDSAATNRTLFPLTGGFFSLNSEHTTWTAGVSISSKAQPATFDDFSTIVPFFKAAGEGIFCLNLDLSKTNATGLTDGQNVTLEIIFDGGDGELFQCADITLSSTATLPACQNSTSTGGSSASGSGSASGSATAPAPSTSATGTQSGGAVRANAAAALLLGAVGVVAAVL
ncbi:hypothetical protein DFH06DRAFT_1168584 [Mycena polygramma]|nr:hypothetical protein DFH06DRAFT_1168584 [Mycena polygramma]